MCSKIQDCRLLRKKDVKLTLLYKITRKGWVSNAAGRFQRVHTGVVGSSPRYGS